MHKFMEGWLLEPGAVGLDEYARGRFMQSRDYWHHLKSWWAQKDQDNVLFLVYEHMQLDLELMIRRIAEFIRIELDDQLLVITLEHASLPFMLEHKDRFDDTIMVAFSEKRCLLPPGGDASKVRAGKVGEHKQSLSPELIAELDQIWHEEIEQTLGFKDYEALIAAV